MGWTEAASAHRGTRAIQRLVEHAPATGGMALWMAHRDVAAGDIPGAIATDGQALLYAPGFEGLDLPTQAGWVAHEVLHVAFRHVARMHAVRDRVGEVDEQLFNACADAIVNATLAHLTWLSLPARAVTLDAVLDRALKVREPVEKSLLAWDVERLYRAIDDRQRPMRPVSGSEDEGDGDGSGRRDGGSTAGGPPRDGPRAAAVRSLAASTLRDLVGGEDEPAEAAAEATREWEERLVRGHAEDGAFSLLRSLGADVPASRVPWEHQLRVRLMRGLTQEPELSWSRPARSWLANRGRSPGGRRMPWQPGVVSQRAVPRLAVVLDISGSIDDALLGRLAAELNAISRRAGAIVVFIAGDDAVRHVEEFQPGTLGLPPLEGGGGTDFEPLLEEAMRRRCDLAVVLTDLLGPTGSRPRFPVHWVVPRSSADVPMPFGERVVLDA
ncbi:MAG: VWA-like domain-containing protein [Pseudomonadota bacterium]